MADINEQREEVEKMLSEIEERIKKRWEEESFASKYGIERDILVGENEVMGVLFVLPDKKEEVREKIDEWFPKRKFSIAVFSLRVQEFIKKFAQEWKSKRNKDLKIGKEIDGLEGNGVALYINWTSAKIMLHKYREGKFLSRSCKKTSLWQTSNGVWIIGFKDIGEAREFAGDLQKKLKKHFGKDYSINLHSLCCNQEKEEKK